MNVILQSGAGVLFVLLGVVAQVLSAPQQPGNSDFDFSIYFTGNTRGSLEPCG